MKNLSKKFSSFFAAFAVVFTMGTATTTTSAEACHWGGCHTHNSCSYLKGKENYFKGLANRYLQGSFMYNHYMNKANYYKNRYNQSGCEPTPPPVQTGSLCGYVFVDGKANISDGLLVTITQADGTLLTTRVNSQGKWSLSNVKAGNVTVHIKVSDINLNEGEILSQTYGQNSSSAVVLPNKLNDGKVDIFSIIDA